MSGSLRESENSRLHGNDGETSLPGWLGSTGSPRADARFLPAQERRGSLLLAGLFEGVSFDANTSRLYAATTGPERTGMTG